MLKKGDKVVTTAGLIGELMGFEDNVARVKIAPGTTVSVVQTSVSLFDTSAATAKTDKDLADLKEAKATADKK
jgi:preprotein translocase subunit YajC